MLQVELVLREDDLAGALDDRASAPNFLQQLDQKLSRSASKEPALANSVYAKSSILKST
jgi:hypothetical protein